jgi:hypothetical protein
MRRNDLKGGESATQDAADIETWLKARKLLAEVEERDLRLGLAHIIANHPGPTLWLDQTDDDAKDQSESRLQKLFDE